MGKSTRCPIIAAIAVLFFVPGISTATTYRVGPGEKYAKVSEVAARLRAGDIVEITGNIIDTFTLSAHGTDDSAITIRGITFIDNGRTVRPKLLGKDISPTGAVVTCRGNFNVIEGLDIQVDSKGLVEGSACILVGGDNDVVRNCGMSLSWLGVATDGQSSGDIVIEFCDFDSLYRPLGFNYRALPARRLSTATVQHCYIHDCTGGYTMLRSEYPRTAVRYNWFENASNKAMSFMGPSWPEGKRDSRSEACWPAHADIVGNVFFHGISPDGTHAILTLGGEDEECPGPEGEVNIAHNLFIRTENGWDEELSSHILMLPGVERVNLFNNIFMDYVNRASSVYNAAWAARMPGYQNTPEFAAKHGGSIIAPASGSNNWVSQDAGGIPSALEGTIRGLNPGMVSFLDQDYRPRADSPLAGGGTAALPQGRIIDLVPEYEPLRGIPLDLRPIKRRRAAVPSIGPFGVPVENVHVEGADEALETVLNAQKSGARFPWQLEFGRALQQARVFAARGDVENAFRAARMHFILSPDSKSSTKRVSELLGEIDGDNVRAESFVLYATHGSQGADGRPGTEDDLEDPLADISLDVLAKDESCYGDLDAAIEARMTFSSESAAKESFYVTRKAFARINGGAFDDAAAILLESLERLVTLDEKGRKDRDGHAEFKRVQHQMDSIKLGLGAYYRATTGTTKGVDEFVTLCISYCIFGPMGPDKKLGTEDDLAPPL